MVRRSLIVLVINNGHNTIAASIRNGKVLPSVLEERLNNIIHFDIKEIFNKKMC
jgi:hypothetical protein